MWGTLKKGGINAGFPPLKGPGNFGRYYPPNPKKLKISDNCKGAKKRVPGRPKPI